MNDNIIISTISKIYFTIITILFFIFLTFFTAFIALQNGITIEKISQPNFQVEQLYIKWNEKLNISIKEVVILADESESNSEIGYKQVINILSQLSIFNAFFENIEIKGIYYSDITASFKYSQYGGSYLKAISPDIELTGAVHLNSKAFRIEIKKLLDKTRDISASGDIIFENHSKDIVSKLNIEIAKEAKLRVYMLSNSKNFFYKAYSTEKIVNRRKIKKLLQLDKTVEQWAFNAIEAESINLDALYGWVDYSDVDSALDNLNIYATGVKLNYTYDKLLDAIHTKKTEVIFKHNKLYIYPKDGYTYDRSTGTSWLVIDFNKDDIPLNIALRFDGRLDKNMHKILHNFGVKIPFLQNSGSTNIKLDIKVGLRDIDIYAKGVFYTKKANFDYLGVKIDVFDAKIKLDGTKVTINNMLAKYDDILTSKVDVKFDANTQVGDIYFNVKELEFKESAIKANIKKHKLKARFHLSPDNNTLHVEKHIWRFNRKNFHVQKATIPLNVKTVTTTLPKTLVTVKNLGKAYISGTTDIKNFIHNYNIELFHLNYNNIELGQKRADIKLHYTDKLLFNSTKNIKLLINKVPSLLGKSKIDIDGGNIKIEESTLHVNSMVDTKITGVFNTRTQKGKFLLKDSTVKDKKGKILYASIKKLPLHVVDLDTKIVVDIPKLKMKYQLIKGGWNLKMSSLRTLSKYSPFMRKYKINSGTTYMFTKTNEKLIHYTGNVNYPYAIFTDKNRVIKKFKTKGSIKKSNSDIYINLDDKVDIKMGKKLTVKVKDYGLNMHGIIDVLNNKKMMKSNGGESKEIKGFVKNSFVYVADDRYVLADKIYLRYIKGVSYIKLQHKRGTMWVTIDGDKLSMHGEKFNDTFMNSIFKPSKFHNGSLYFSTKGKIKDNKGVMYVEDTTLMDFKAINNILAFINTIPSLLTFSLPDYNSKGLGVKKAYMDFHAVNFDLNITNVNLDSNELDISGNGTMSFIKNKIDMKLKLTTDIGSSLSNVPLVGHVVLGGEPVSTAMALKGKFNDPTIETALLKSLILAPFNILKRILTLPFGFVGSSPDNNSTVYEDAISEGDEEDY